MNMHNLDVAQRAALYLRVSTTRQAEHDVSIPDQRRQGEAWCASHGYQLSETYVEAGASATSDKRPEFQRMIEAGTSKPAPFDVVVVHSFSRFFRDHFELEFYVRKLAKNGVKLVSITQEMGDDPMHVMMRQIMALFDEYQSKENAKHVLRAMKENARQGFWNGALPPVGYRIVAAEQRGSKTKKKLEIDPLHADTVRMIYRLFLEGDGATGPMGVKAIACYLNEHRFFTRDGGRWGLAQIHTILTRTTYIGEHRFNTRSHKDRVKKEESEVAIMAVPPLIDRETFDAVQARLKSRQPMVTPARVTSGPTLLTGICFCAKCGAPSEVSQGGWQRGCPACKAQHFPRTDPVVIMLITRGNSVLMGRSPGWPQGMYSLLAGFVEPGETIEAAVRREVVEESGIKVGAVSYLASQPWPFPASLMFGCMGEAESDEITVDPDELEDARWVTREEMMQVFAGEHPEIKPARKGAIAHFLLHNWLADTLD